MLDMFSNFFNADYFMPHGHCYLWRPDILWLNVGSDAMIALAYFSIPVSLVYFIRKRKDVAFNWMFLMFALFIVACGTTHLFGMWTVWNPNYGMQGLVKLFTGVVSMATAVALWPLMPKALALPSPEQLRKANDTLRTEVEQRKAAQAELAEQNRKLIEAERLKTEFLANVSHELRTPLTLIMAPLDSLLETNASRDKSEKAAIQTAHNNSARLLQMINGLLDFSKFEAGKIDVRLEPTDAAQLTRTIVEDFQPSAKVKKVDLSMAVETDKESLPVMLDRYLFERIAFNLISNAIKFTPEGRDVKVSLSYVDKKLVLRVVDRGIGIAKSEVGNLFQKFRQIEGSSNRRFQGTGLGLALVKEFAGLMGGEVTVESELDEGSTFSVSIPTESVPEQKIVRENRKRLPELKIIESEPSEQDQANGSAISVEDRQALPKILIAEDNAEIASLIASTLGRICQSIIVKNGKEALSRLADWQPDLIVSDVMMPGIDGFELCRRIKSNPETSLIPVLLVTALTHRDAIVTAFNAGADDYIPKPFHPRELEARIKSVLSAIEARKSAEGVLVSYNERLQEEVRQRTNELEDVNKELDSQKKHLSLIINSLPAGVAYIDPSQRFVYCNETYAKWHGLAPQKIVGKTLKEVTGESNYAKLRPLLDQALAGSKVALEIEKKYVDKTRVVDIQAVPDVSGAGKIRGFVELTFDASAYKSIQRQLQVAKEDAEAASLAKSEFLANMSHEIRTPLGAVVGFSELVASPGISASERLNFVATIQRNSDLLSNIINDILDLSKVEVGRLDIEKKSVEIREILSDITSLLNLKASEKGVGLTVTADGAIPERITTDPMRLRQILLNIVGNAIKFTESGSVEIKIRQQSGTAQTLLAFDVKDTGLGISESEARQLFRPFTQIDGQLTRKYGGTGLGLALSRRLAKLLGGDLVLTKSKKGEGSTFTITIDPGQSAQVLFQSNLRTGPSSSQDAEKKEIGKGVIKLNNGLLDGVEILLVDDSLDNQALVQVHLKRAGAKVDVASNGDQAVQMALAKTYDIVLMDLQMPIKDGYAATRELRDQGYGQPIIALTAHALTDEIAKCLASGFDGHVSKPISRDILLNTIRELIAKDNGLS